MSNWKETLAFPGASKGLDNPEDKLELLKWGGGYHKREHFYKKRD